MRNYALRQATRGNEDPAAQKTVQDSTESEVARPTSQRRVRDLRGSETTTRKENKVPETLSESHGGRGCPPGCQCKRHTMRNSGQFRSGVGIRCQEGCQCARHHRGHDRPQFQIGPENPNWRDPELRFRDKIRAAENGCVLWIAGAPNGYGVFMERSWRQGGRMRRAHAWAWERANGPIPQGFVLHHTCGNKLCVNHNHLVAMSQADHVRLEMSLSNREPQKQGGRDGARRRWQKERATT